ncbi:MAG: hypothetical protein ACE3JQ_12145 [Paenisporosarcina sp.]
MDNQDNNRSELDFLRPLSKRPDLDPDIHFVNNLRNELTQKTRKTKNKWITNFVPFTIGSLAIVTCFALVFLFFNKTVNENEDVNINEPDNHTPIMEENDESLIGEEDIPIAEYESITPVLKMEYGTESGEVGEIQHTPGGSGLGPMSFFVKNNVFYILDNSGKKIIITTKNQHHSTIQLNEDSWLTDIFVDEAENIYVLDASSITVSKYNKGGKLVETYPIDVVSTFILTDVTVNQNNEILVSQHQDRTLNLMTGKYIYAKEKLFSVNRKNEEFGEIILNESGKNQIIKIPFEHSFGGISVHSVKSNQIIFEKTEVSPNTPNIMIEMHMYVIDKNAVELGAVRIPQEKSQYASSQNIRVDHDKIYYLCPEKDGLYIYELTPGKKFEKRLQQQIDSYLKEKS